METKKKISYYLTVEQDRWLSEEAERTGLGRSEIIRRAIDEYRQRKRGPRESSGREE